MLIPTVRRIHNINSDKVIGRNYSVKMAGYIQWESLLERDNLLWLEFRRDVIAYRSQPDTYRYINHEGRDLAYTPDVEVVLSDHPFPICQEVKPSDVARDPTFEVAHEARRKALLARERELHLVTEEQIRREPHLSSIKFLSAYAGVEALLPCEQLVMAQTLTRLGGMTSVQALASALSNTDIRIDQLFREAFSGALWLDISRPASVHSLVRMRREP